LCAADRSPAAALAAALAAASDRPLPLLLLL
jgi:hypothetical protein